MSQPRRHGFRHIKYAVNREQNVSDQLIWGIVKRHNAQMVARRGTDNVIFTREANNLLNRHSYKSSGLVESNTVGLELRPEGGVTLSVGRRQSRNLNKPATSRVNHVLNSTWERNFGTLTRIVDAKRHDLVHNAKRRFGRLTQVRVQSRSTRNRYHFSHYYSSSHLLYLFIYLLRFVVF